MTKKRSQTSRASLKAESEAKKAARELLEEIVQQDPRLKAACDTVTNSVGNGASVVEQSLRTFRQRLTD